MSKEIITEQRLQAILSDWRQWRSPFTTTPHIIKPLKGGTTNQSFLIGANNQLAVLRINATNSKQLGINRQQEADILERLQPVNCTAACYFADHHIRVSEYLNGRQWTAADLTEHSQQKKIADVLARIQTVALPHGTPRMNYTAYCQHYLQQLNIDNADNKRQTLLVLTEQIDSLAWAPVISHHDLAPENIIETDEGIKLLDWEYANYSHPAMDYVQIYGEQYQHPHSKILHQLITAINQYWQQVKVLSQHCVETVDQQLQTD